MIKCIVFSRNRPTQLDVLVQSIKINLPVFDEISVLYTTSGGFTDDFNEGYKRLFRTLHPELIPVWEYNFKEDLLDIIHTSSVNGERDYVCFFTDDDIVYRNSNLNSLYIYSIFENLPTCFSLRLGKNIKRANHHDNTPTAFPERILYENPRCFLWNTLDVPQYGHFNYVFSLDGCFYRVKLLEQLFSKFEFDNPNILEGCAQQYFPRENIMMAPHNSCVVGNPINRVQDVFQNKAGLFYGKSVEDLNDEFLKGKRVYLEDIVVPEIEGVHCEIELNMR